MFLMYFINVFKKGILIFLYFKVIPFGLFKPILLENMFTQPSLSLHVSFKIVSFSLTIVGNVIGLDSFADSSVKAKNINIKKKIPWLSTSKFALMCQVNYFDISLLVIRGCTNIT